MSSLSGVVNTWKRVSETSSRTAKVQALAECLKSLSADETDIGVLYLAGELKQGKFGLGYASLRDASGQEPAANPQLTLTEVDRRFSEIAALRGPGSAARRIEALRILFDRATQDEREFLIRLLVGELRQGALGGVMVDAVATAAGFPVADVRRASMYAPNLGELARIAFTQGGAALDAFQLQPLAPVAPMLAQSAADVADALRQLGGEAAFEWKVDGARIQVHKAGDVIRIYTRSLNDVTRAVPEIVEAVQKMPAGELVLDGEVVALDRNGKPRPFQVTMRRFGRKLDVAALRAELPLHAFFFDCLRVDGRSLADRPARERFAALAQAVPEALAVPRLVTRDPARAQAFYDDALARGHEGVMAKAPDSPYEAGNRGASWLKIKRAHTLDLVVLAAEWGHGRRTGRLSNLHLGARDPSSGEYVMLGKTFKGLTDALLEWQTAEFLAREVRRDQWTVYVRPELVVEIAFNDIQTSSQYPGGLALRFARVKGYRTDKRVDEADTMDEVRKIYAAQGGVENSGSEKAGSV
jgi:DNA ligase-1